MHILVKEVIYTVFYYWYHNYEGCTNMGLFGNKDAIVRAALGV